MPTQLELDFTLSQPGEKVPSKRETVHVDATGLVAALSVSSPGAKSSVPKLVLVHSNAVSGVGGSHISERQQFLSQAIAWGRSLSW